MEREALFLCFFLSCRALFPPSAELSLYLAVLVLRFLSPWVFFLSSLVSQLSHLAYFVVVPHFHLFSLFSLTSFFLVPPLSSALCPSARLCASSSLRLVVYIPLSHHLYVCFIV